MRSPTARIALLALALAGCTALSREPGQVAPAVGSVAPDFSLPTVDGTRFSLSEATARGPVVLVFYRAHW